MKAEILKLLRAQKNVISGETLSAELGISRVSIWKHIQKLNQVGYRIESGPRGYRLEHAPDTPFPWEFPARESQMHYLDETSSTMEIAKALARKGCPDFTVVVAGRQNKGRGRLNRVWISDAGGLYFTLVLRPRLPIVLGARVSFLASLTLARVLREWCEIDAKVKWPNDILVGERKISGMLTEMEAEADQINFINLGIGINVNNDPTQSEPRASSIKTIRGKSTSRKELLARFLDELASRMQQPDLDDVVSEWKKYTLTLNRRVQIVTNREASEGLAVDVDENGALVLELDDGTRKKILYGDCFHADE